MTRATSHPQPVYPAPTWELTPAARTPQLGAILRVGARAIPVSQIRGFVGSAERDADKNPSFAILIVFGIAALFFLLGVLDIGWRQRFLVATVLFGMIALSAFHDMYWQTTSGIFRVEILTANGETIRYATIRAEEQEALLAELAKLVTRPTAANDDGEASDVPPPVGRPWVRLTAIAP